MSVNWMTFSTTDWQESNPEKVFSDIVEMGSNTFQLAIKDVDEETKEETVIGYLPQSMEQAHLLLKDLAVKGANFASYKFDITGIEIDGETQEEVEIKKIWSPDVNMPKGTESEFFDGQSWKLYVSIQDHVSKKELVPNKSNEYYGEKGSKII